MGKIDPKRLEGLKFREIKAIKSEKVIDGKKKVVVEYQAKIRDMTPEDIGAMAERPEGTVIVDNNGQKYTLKK